MKNPQEDMAFFVKGLFDRSSGPLVGVKSSFAGSRPFKHLLRPILFRQQRVGREEKFSLYKLRTMVRDAGGIQTVSTEGPTIPWSGLLRESGLMGCRLVDHLLMAL
jgi:hypothetical protein